MNPVSRIASRFPISRDLGFSIVISIPLTPVIPRQIRKGTTLSPGLKRATITGMIMNTDSMISSTPITRSNIGMLM